MLRRQSTTLYVIVSLTVGVLWLIAATMVLGVKVNFANFIAFPITFGIGVDYSVNVMSRYVQDGRRDVVRTLRATGSAVALCSLTTISDTRHCWWRRTARSSCSAWWPYSASSRVSARR